MVMLPDITDGRTVRYDIYLVLFRTHNYILVVQQTLYSRNTIPCPVYIAPSHFQKPFTIIRNRYAMQIQI